MLQSLLQQLTLALSSAQPKKKGEEKKRAPEIELQQLQMFEQCQENRPPGCHICVFSSSNDCPNKLMVHSARLGRVDVHRGRLQHMLPAHVL